MIALEVNGVARALQVFTLPSSRVTPLTLKARGNDGFVDKETGTQWDILGHERSGPLIGKQMRPIAHHRVFWFTWSAFVADRASLYDGPVR